MGAGRRRVELRGVWGGVRGGVRGVGCCAGGWGGAVEAGPEDDCMGSLSSSHARGSSDAVSIPPRGEKGAAGYATGLSSPMVSGRGIG